MRRMMMFAAVVGAMAVPGLASAGVYGDDMSKCLVRSTSTEDQTQLVTWVFAAISAHPAVRAMSNLSEAQRQDYTRKAGALMQRLMTVDCRKETVAALKYEGPGAIGPAFGLLGQTAMRGLMSDPSVNKGMAALGDNIDEAAFAAMAKEAGIEPDAKK